MRWRTPTRKGPSPAAIRSGSFPLPTSTSRLLRSKADWDGAPPPAVIAQAQRTIAWAEHLVIIYPLWLGGMPALLKGFLEQALRPAFMTGGAEAGSSWKTALKGRSSRIVVTMGMPAFVYRWYFGRTASRASSAASCP